MGQSTAKNRSFVLDEHIQVRPFVGMGIGNGRLSLDLYMVGDFATREMRPAIILSAVPGFEEKTEVDRDAVQKIAARLSKIPGSAIWEIKGQSKRETPRFLITNKEHLDRVIRQGLGVKGQASIELVLDVLYDLPELRERRPVRVRGVPFAEAQKKQL